MTGSSSTHDVRRAVIMQRLLSNWEKASAKGPVRLAQIIIEAVAAECIDPVRAMSSMEDAKLLELIERHILKP